MGRPISSLDATSACDLVEYLARNGWSIGESEENGYWTAIAHKSGFGLSGTGPTERDAWQDLYHRMHHAGEFALR